MRYRTLVLAGVAVVATGVALITPVVDHHAKAATLTATGGRTVPGARPPAPARLGGGQPGSGGGPAGVGQPGAGGGPAGQPGAAAGQPGEGPAGGVDAGGGRAPAGRPVPLRTPVVQPLLGPHPVRVAGTVFFGWSLLDRPTGEIVGSTNRESGTNSTESMIKAWIASDYLRRLGNSQPSAATLHDLTLMIIDSNDNMAQKYYAMDGHNAVVARLIQMCGLRDTSIYNAWWSKTQMSPADAVRYGRCVADGKAAGPKWTPWILTTMTHVRGDVNYQQATTGGGHWGIIDALPPDVAKTTSIKNGWTSYNGVWHVNCMAIQKDWVLSVMMRYPSGKGLAYGADICASVTRQLTNPPIVASNGVYPSPS